MGGRGSSSMGAASHAKAQRKATAENTAPKLDSGLIKQADNAHVYNMGTSTSETYKSRVDEINNMNLTESQKAEGINKLHSLTENQLKAEATSVNPYVAGPARFNVSKTQRNADKAANAKSETDSFMNGLRDKSKANNKAQSQSRRAEAVSKALKEGALSFTVDGVTWTRKSKRSKTFTAVR